MIRKSVNIRPSTQDKINEIRFGQQYKRESDVIREALEIGIREIEERGKPDGKLERV